MSYNKPQPSPSGAESRVSLIAPKGTPVPTRAPRPAWDEYFLSIADVVAVRSTCTRRRVGAVLVCDRSHRIIATGYNGAPAGMDHCVDGACPRGRKTYDEQPAFAPYNDCIAWHAERNAVQQFLLTFPDREALDGLTMYVTCQPCPDCAALLEHHRIGAVWLT